MTEISTICVYLHGVTCDVGHVVSIKTKDEQDEEKQIWHRIFHLMEQREREFDTVTIEISVAFIFPKQDRPTTMYIVVPE